MSENIGPSYVTAASHSVVEEWLKDGINVVFFTADRCEDFNVANAAPLFGNVYRRDSLDFWAQQGLNYEKVRDFVGLDKTDLSRVAHVKKSSVRFDDRIPPELKERLEQIANCCLLVADHFNGDVQKTSTWFSAANPMLGNVSPRDMIRFGRFAKLQRFIAEAVRKDAERATATP